MTERQADKLTTWLLWIYVIGAFLTNAYMREFRWEQWKDAATGKAAGFEVIQVMAGTALWPVYWAARGASELVRWLADIQITIN